MTPNLPTQIDHRAIAGLIPYARNSRTHSAEQVGQIAASIREFGFTNPVLVDAEGGIIAGHGRVMAAQRLGLEAVPVIVLAHLSDAQKRAYVIADNKLALNAGWDEAVLAAELRELQAEDFDLDLLGFDDDLPAMMTVGAEQAAAIISRTTVTKGQHAGLANGGSSMRPYIEAGFKPLPGFQFRYLYFINPKARERLTVPVLPFSDIEKAGAAMYRGEKITRAKEQDAGHPPALGGATPTCTLQTKAERGA